MNEGNGLCGEESVALPVEQSTCSKSLIRGTKCITEAVRGENATSGKRLSHSLQQRSQNSVIGTIPCGWNPSTYNPGRKERNEQDRTGQDNRHDD